MLFFGGTKKSAMKGNKVVINEGSKTPEQRRDRARNRMDNLQGKIRRLERKDQTKEVKSLIEQTRNAIEEWERRAIIAEFEIKVNQGEK